MRAFKFSFETILRVRTRELELEQMKLTQLYAELRRIDTQLTRLEQAGPSACRALGDETVGTELLHLQRFRESLAVSRKQLLKDKAGCEFRLGQQQRKVVEADRRKRLLERLKERRQSEWQADLDKEWEHLAADTYLARWKG